jgi:hypothetical protein
MAYGARKTRSEAAEPSTAQVFDVTMFANTNVAVRAAVENCRGFIIFRTLPSVRDWRAAA